MKKKILFLVLFPLILFVVFLVIQWRDTSDKLIGPTFVTLYEHPEDISFRGLYAIDDSVVVVGGNRGIVGFSTDAGEQWTFQTLPEASNCQFRSVWAHNHSTFLAVSAGAPSYIYLTEDGGKRWSRVFEDTAQATFLDGIQFINDTLGYIYGDPVSGYFKLLRTIDGGRSWKEVIGPEAIDGEVSFAASGSAITLGNNMLSIVTGGTVSRLHVTLDWLQGDGWTASPIEMAQGLPSQGAFAHYWAEDKLFIVGGDYMREKDTTGTAVVVNLSTGQDDELTNKKLQNLPYTSDVCGDGDYMYFTGTEGMRYMDSNLHILDTMAMHTLVYSGKYVFASGPKGRIGRVFNGTIEDLTKLVKRNKK